MVSIRLQFGIGLVGLSYPLIFNNHAIFSGVLSLWFTNWDNCWEMFLNAILLGIVVEGINFYGVGELFLFLTKNTTEMTYHNSVLISCLFTFVLLLLYIIAFLINRM